MGAVSPCCFAGGAGTWMMRHCCCRDWCQHPPYAPENVPRKWTPLPCPPVLRPNSPSAVMSVFWSWPSALGGLVGPQSFQLPGLVTRVRVLEPELSRQFQVANRTTSAHSSWGGFTRELGLIFTLSSPTLMAGVKRLGMVNTILLPTDFIQAWDSFSHLKLLMILSDGFKRD